MGSAESKFRSLINRLVDVKRSELLPVVAAFCWFFMLFSSYNILRPIRDAVAASLSKKEVAELFFWVFVALMIAVPAYANIVSRVPRKILIQIVFHFLAVNIVLFAAFNYVNPAPAQTDDLVNVEASAALAAGVDERISQESEEEAEEVAEEETRQKPPRVNKMFGRIFFVWVSVFILFAGSVIWSFLADVFSNEQGKRLFGPIASGATIGSIAGSQFAMLAPIVGLTGLLVLSACLLEAGVIFATWLGFLTRSWRTQARTEKKSGGFIQGLNEIRTSPYLILICVYLALFSVCGTSLYMQLSAAVKAGITDPDEKIAYFGWLNFLTQTGTLIVQTLIVSRLMKYAGLSVTLCLMPVVYCCCFVLLGFSGSVVVLGIIDVASRITAYGATVPAREVLFTVVSKDAKYKSKSFMDTVVIRGSDAAASGVIAAISNAVRLNWYLIPVAAVFGTVGWLLGAKQRTLAKEQANSDS